MTARSITLRGVAVHNLKHVDLDIPHRQLVVLCGLSGSGKTSLALDTLYAEGQRRYIDSFSAYTRQFLERLEKPAAERIDGIPPAIAVTHKNTSRSSRSTVGTATETSDYLRLLFAKIGRVFCQQCGQEVRRHTPQSVAEVLAELPEGTRFLIAFAAVEATGELRRREALQEEGFVRAIVGSRLVNLTDERWRKLARSRQPAPACTPSSTGWRRQRQSGSGCAIRWKRLCQRAGPRRVFVERIERRHRAACPAQSPSSSTALPGGRPPSAIKHACDDCGLDLPEPEPRLFSFNSPLGACPECEGFGNVIDVDMDLVVPDRDKSLREGAIAPWNTPAYAHELEELLALADDYDLPSTCRFAN